MEIVSKTNWKIQRCTLRLSNQHRQLVALMLDAAFSLYEGTNDDLDLVQ